MADCSKPDSSRTLSEKSIQTRQVVPVFMLLENFALAASKKRGRKPKGTSIVPDTEVPESPVD